MRNKTVDLTRGLKTYDHQPVITEQDEEAAELDNIKVGENHIPTQDAHEVEAQPSDFKVCLACSKALNEDEKIINARFVNEAIERGGDISVFPVCIKCNFE